MEILSSARKHGISDDDIRHGVNNAGPRSPDLTSPSSQCWSGPPPTGSLLKIGVFAAEPDYVIHAMPARTNT